jgi:hypothetical protein
LSASYGFEEPDGFRGLKWGMSAEGIKKIVQEQIPGPAVGIMDYGTETLHYEDWIAGALTKLSLNFVDGKFARVSITFDPKDFETIREVFVKRYGKPMASITQEVGTARGVKLANPVLTWQGTRIAIVLSKYGNTIIQGLASIGQKELFEKDEKERKKRILDAAKNL